ncbi:hypothetical protein [Streptomyces glomeratus]|uniref:hypothetical protein n=1 Tax=Streptomyces glomeratus TaxID=284452 RepID=UPI0022789858|nr:hypothetical protein [Streptomyces glomeratus]
MAAEYDGVDALMAAITGEPLPDAARSDAEFMAGHRAALADVALLRKQLGVLGDALAAPSPEAPSPEAPSPEAPSPEVPSPEVPSQSPEAPSPAAAPSRPLAPRPVRPARRGRALRLAFGSLAAVVALSAVVGLARLVALGGGADDAASKSSADSAGAVGPSVGDGPPPSDPEREVACSRLVVEGTVSGVGPLDGPRIRVVLTVTRYYRPDGGPSQVTVLLDGGAEPRPRRGQHVLIRVPRGGDGPTLWAVGEERVAANRAWITGALPGSRHTGCPSGGPS